ncbi:MAG: signal peptidase I [Treponema sp.]|jgi:signal peptidase I|nr:signal peptidase I [Treponema sp.]
MFDKWMQYSYAAQKHQRHRYLKFFFVFFMLFLLYNVLSAFFISIWALNNDTMQPGLAAGDRLVFTSFFLPSKESQFPYKRGNIVLVDMGSIKDRKAPLKAIDTVVRFFTAQRHSIFPRDEQYYIKRVIALPGDEIYMNNFVFRVKPAGSPYTLTEFELAQKPYHPYIPNVPALWDETIPFSGNMDTIILGPDECFVVSDDRSNTNDSRTWGTVSPSSITAKALVRFWPIKKFELF